MAREQGWMAEHMLILGLEDPSGKVTYMAAAFPSACGKTNLAMMVSALENKGYRVWTVGDDIAWMHVGSDGTLRAINPEAGFFGVAPGTNEKTNPNVIEARASRYDLHNIAITAAGEPWWEGMDGAPPPGAHRLERREMDARARALPRNPIRAIPSRPSNHPRFRLTGKIRKASRSQRLFLAAAARASLRSSTNHATGSTAFLSEPRWLRKLRPLPREPSASRAAIPMAMLPFCGYNMADYFRHWLDMGPKLKNPPKIFHVNWFRKDADGKFLWPGYGENVRVLKWILDRIEGRAAANDTPIGYVPTADSLTLDGLNISRAAIDELLKVDSNDWAEELDSTGKFFEKFGKRLPEEIRAEHNSLAERLQRVSVAPK